MALVRVLRPLSRQGPRTLAPRSSAHLTRRFLNTDTAPVLFTAHSEVIGARDGHIKGDVLDLNLTTAGEKGKTNPEELFAAGYGACFQSAMNACAPTLKIQMPKKKEDSIIETAVHLVGDMGSLDLGIKVDMKVKVRGMKKEDIEKVIEKTKEVCPYSRATKGNVTTNVEVEILS